MNATFPQIHICLEVRFWFHFPPKSNNNNKIMQNFQEKSVTVRQQENYVIAKFVFHKTAE